MNAVEMEKLNELINDKGFVEMMMSQETPEAVQKVFNEHGVPLTLEDVKRIGSALNQMENPGAELSEADLDGVAGGFALTAATCWAIAKAVIAIGSAGLAIYKWYKSR